MEEQAIGGASVLVFVPGELDLGFQVAAYLSPPFSHYSDDWEGSQVSEISVPLYLSGPSVGSLPMKHLCCGVT